MKKPTLLSAVLAMVLTASVPVLAQTGDMQVTRPDPNDPYRVLISNDQAIYCGHAVVGSPIYDFCIEKGIVPPVLYDRNGNLIVGNGTNAGIQYDNTLPDLCISPRPIGDPNAPVGLEPCTPGVA